MAMGHAEAFVITVAKEDLIKQNFTSLIELEEMLVEHNETMDSFARAVSYLRNSGGRYVPKSYMDVNVLKQGLTLYNRFQSDFNEKYKLTIMLGYHNSEQESIYDEAYGDGYFTINFGDVYEITEQAKNMQKEIPFEISQFATFS